MPLYQVSHCIPLSREQKDALAEFITNLHATTFVTPRLFVNVTFDQPGPIGDIYAGGKSRGQTVPNNIRALIRVGPSRPKEKYDQLALEIQRRWYEVVNDGTLGAQSLGNLSTEQETRAKQLHGIVFCPFVSAVEQGLVVPAPGDEGTWFKDNMPHFMEQVHIHNNNDVREMLKEVSEREDMKNFVE